MKPIRAIDLCCGAGGWAAAARGLPIEWVAVADLASDCLETWRINHAWDHPGVRILQEDLATDMGVCRVLDACEAWADLVVGGIPCEEVSCARGANKPDPTVMERWHQLLDNVLGLVKRIGPRWWSIEDVIQVEGHLVTPIEFGSSYPVRRIDASDFGPQRRLRTFIGAFPSDLRARPDRRRTLGECLSPGPFATEPAIESYTVNPPGRNASRVGHDAIRLLDPDRPCFTIMGSLGQGSRQRRAFMTRSPTGVARRLTWQECARVQGFPEDYLFAATGAGRLQKMVGQAISVDVGRAILEAVCREADVTPRAD